MLILPRSIVDLHEDESPYEKSENRAPCVSTQSANNLIQSICYGDDGHEKILLPPRFPEI